MERRKFITTVFSYIGVVVGLIFEYFICMNIQKLNKKNCKKYLGSLQSVTAEVLKAKEGWKNDAAKKKKIGKVLFLLVPYLISFLFLVFFLSFLLFSVAITIGCASAQEAAPSKKLGVRVKPERVAKVEPPPAPKPVPRYQQRLEGPIAECPSCGNANDASDKRRNEAITCSVCEKIFPYRPSQEQTMDEKYAKQKKPFIGPNVLRRGYFYNRRYSRRYNYGGKSDWKVSPDGWSGTMSNSSWRVYDNQTTGYHGQTVGPGNFSRTYGY